MKGFQYLTTSLLRFAIAILAFGIMGSCTPSESTPTNTTPYNFSKINCYVRYIAQTRELQAEMTFRTDSTTGISGQVLFNDEPMLFKQLPMVGYQYRLIKNSPKFEQKNTFTYTERDGSLTNMEIELSPFDSLRIASATVSREKGGLLEWQGEALQKEDGLVFIFTDAQGNTFTINHSGMTRGNYFDILPEHSNRLELGKATVQVVRKKTILNKEKETIKMLTVEHYLGNLEFDVKK